MTPAEKSAPSVATSMQLLGTPEQLRVVERIAAQRERMHARATARAQFLASADRNVISGSVDESLVLRVFGFAREHPVVVAAIAGVALIAGPRKLVRWTGVILPIVLRLRRKAL